MPDTEVSEAPIEAPIEAPTDSLHMLNMIAEALAVYARTVPDVGVAKVRFGLIPFVDLNQNVWRATVTLECLGNLERIEEPKLDDDGQAEFLDGVQPTQVFERSWKAEGTGGEGAIQALYDAIRNFLHSSMMEREAEAGALKGALEGMAKAPLPELWSDEDPDYVNPQEDIPADPG